MLEKMEAVAKAVLVVIGALAALCGVLAKVLPPGRARDAARDLGFRLGDALGIVGALMQPPKKPEGDK